ncbi:MAG: Phosphatidylinositol-4-phosphate 5-kinase [Alyxoria varia]|nr:MAG: Phosphatidylinositol-4-phosphate 5-kinase [Alyxoria varia]KAI9656099.1 MAG: Phosphatidylinositol-4-phosphate 5-kinase [Alyxoria varia]
MSKIEMSLTISQVNNTKHLIAMEQPQRRCHSDLAHSSTSLTLEVPRNATMPRSSKEQPRGTSDELPNGRGPRLPVQLERRIIRESLSLRRRNISRSTHANLPVDKVPQDDEASKIAESVRQNRESRKARKEEEDDDRVVVGTKVDHNHVNWVTSYNMLTGIRFVVSRNTAKLDRPLTDADFKTSNKFSFDVCGSEMTPGTKYDFKFKDYAPWVFRHLRDIFKVDAGDYLMSLTGKYLLSELGSPGKSGSFFYFSRDYKFIIKTIHHGEAKFLRKILRQYHDHVDKNRNTLLSQFYGLHRVKMPYGRKIHFVVMNNLFPPHRDIHKTFDLKGSFLGREYPEEKLADNPQATLKDLNWEKRNMQLKFGPKKEQAFIDQMERDVALLKHLNIMDYSMLIGIHDVEKGNEENLRDKTLQIFQPGGDELEEEPQAPQDQQDQQQQLTQVPELQVPEEQHHQHLQVPPNQQDSAPQSRIPSSAIAPSSAWPSSRVASSALPSTRVTSGTHTASRITSGSTLTRTPSKIESARKARELRQMIKQQRPIAISSSSSKMPDELPEDMAESRKDFYFYSDDGGFRATHEDNTPAEEIYYLGIIDCLTRYNVVKKAEHFVKGLLNHSQKADISAVPPERYGNRFVNFIRRGVNQTRNKKHQ